MTVVADFLPALMITFFSVSCTTAACPITGGGVASTTVRSSFVFKEGQRSPCLRHLAFSFSVFFSD